MVHGGHGGDASQASLGGGSEAPAARPAPAEPAVAAAMGAAGRTGWPAQGGAIIASATAGTDLLVADDFSAQFGDRWRAAAAEVQAAQAAQAGTQALA